MSKIIINGGKPLQGTVRPVANKNSIVAMLPATMLTDEDVIIHNVPMSTDVRSMCALIKKLGAEVEFLNEGETLRINCKNVNSWELDPELSQGIKASVMFMGPLLTRFGKASMPIPGGCKLGTRPLDSFIDNMVQLGAKYRREKGYFLEADKLEGKEVWSWFPSVTGTENLVLMATRIPGKTVIYNAACEPHVQELCELLVQMGANISGIGSNKLIIEGVEHLSGTEYTVLSDHLDVGGFIASSVMTGGEVTIEKAVIRHMGLILQVYEKLGIRVEVDKVHDTIHIPKEQNLTIEKTVRGDVFDFKSFAWPLLPPDLVHVAVVLALYANGSAIFHNSFYEYGFFFIEELAKMKGTVIMADPHRIITFGPTRFQSANLIAPNIIQAAYALLLCCLSAEGKSTLNNAEPLFRRFSDLIDQFSSLGADIVKED
ncbi:MAG: UDP-N-acetylglucosamine 1-carboxyvinyltransferase [Candidatus Dojkabacteria bacterium]